MRTLKANLGEIVGNFLKRAVTEAWIEKDEVIAIHDDVAVVVHPNSLINDICDKFDMQVKIMRLEHKLKGE
jgi:hypothetical protein